MDLNDIKDSIYKRLEEIGLYTTNTGNRRMYYNVCQLLLKRKDIPQNCRELAQLVILAD